MKKISILLIVLAIGYAPNFTQADTSQSGLTIAPYLQRQTNHAITILADTNTAESLQLYYKKSDARLWKHITDTTPSTTHRYRLTSLKRGKTYSYYLASGTTRLTQDLEFSTAHTITDATPLRIAVFGDSGNGSIDQYEVASAMAQWSPDLFLHTGDIAYNSGTTQEFIDKVFTVYSSMLSSVPFYASIGNHDYTTDAAGPYKSLFETPTGSGTEDYYSFTYDKQVHIVSLNSNLDYSVGSTMYNWLNQDLSDHINAPWIIVFFHHPVYSSGEHGSTAGMQTTLQPLFEQYNVDLVLNGHDHDYERFASINGVQYIVTGGGGNTLYTQSTTVPESALFESIHHFLGITITPEELKLQAIDNTGYVFDSVTL